MGVVAALVTAGLAAHTSDISVTSYIADINNSGTPYYVQSDGIAGLNGTRGEYDNGSQGVSSILTANTYNMLPPGDWQLSLLNSTTRTVTLTLTSANAVQTTANAGPLYGTHSYPLKMQDDCTAIGYDPGTMTAGQIVQCPFDINQIPSGQAGVTYSLAMTGSWASAPESTFVQIQCNTVGANGYCNDWFVDPIPVTNPDGSTSPGTAIARLNEHISVHGGTQVVDEGDFYLTFHFHITRP